MKNDRIQMSHVEVKYGVRHTDPDSGILSAKLSLSTFAQSNEN